MTGAKLAVFRNTLRYVKSDNCQTAQQPGFSPAFFSLGFVAFLQECAMHPDPHDLFGEIPVLESELRLWVSIISPRWLSPEHSYRHYVRAYNVADKIRAAKINGTFYDLADRRLTS